MAVVSTNYVPLNSDQYEQTPEEQQAAYEEATANLQNTLLTDGIDLSGLSDLGSMDLFSPNAMRDEWDSNPDHYMNSEYWRAGSGMDNAENAGYMGHYYIGEDGNRYRKVVTYDRERDAMKEEYTDERMYRWSPSDEHKRTAREDYAAEQAYGKEYKGSGGTGWYTEAEIKAAWDAGDMRQMQDQGVSWDQYWGYVRGVDELISAGIIDYKTSKEDSAAILQGEKEADNWMDIPEYRALVEGLGIPMQFENRGDVYNFNGFGYSRDYWSEKSDVTGELITGIAMSAIGGFVVGPLIAGALTPALGATAAKAAAGAITKLAQGYMQTGELNWEDALMSAALSYGGSQLSDALQGSGVLGEIGDKINAVGNAMGEGGGAVLQAALQAGGMSLVTQMVQNGEIDWKDAAVAAAMAGGTALLTSYLSDIGKDPEQAKKELSEWDEFDEWQQEAMNADIKDPFLNPNYKTVGDGLVMNINTNEVFGVTDNKSYGNFADLDKNGDGQLSGSDLQDINVTHEHVSTTPNLPPSNYNEYAENAGGVGRQYYVDENGNVHSGPSIAPDGDGGYYNKIDGTKLKPLTGVYDEKEGLYLFEDENGNIVSVADRSGRIVASYDPETKTWLDANGEFNEDYHNFLDGKYTGSGNISSVENPFSISKEQYDAFSGEQLLDDMWVQKGREGLMNLTDGEMEALIAKFGTGAELEAYLQANGIGVHYSPQSGWVLEAGVDTSDGIYGMNHDGGYIADIEGNPSGISTNFTDPNGTVSNSTTENPFNKEPPKDPNTNSNNSASGADNNDNATGQDNASTDAGSPGGGATDDTGGNGASGPTGGDASTGGNQDSTGDLGGGASGGSGTDSGASAGGGAIGGGSSGLPDFSGMTPAEIAAWWAANGFGSSGGGMLGGDTGGNTEGTENGSGTDSSTGTNTGTGTGEDNSGTGQTPGGGTGDGSTGGDNTGGGDTSGSTDGGDTGAGTGGGGNSTDTEGGGGSGGDNSGTGDGNGDGSGSGTGTGGSGSGSGSGDSGSNSGAGDGTSGGAGSGGGTDGSSGGGSGGSSGGGTGGNSGGTGGGAGGGGEGGGGVGTGLGAGMLGGLGAGSGDNSNPQWGQLFPMKQFVARAKPQTNQQRRASLFADLLKGLG